MFSPPILNWMHSPGLSLGPESQESLTLGPKFSRVKMKYPRVKQKLSRVKITWLTWTDKGEKTEFSFIMFFIYAQK